MAAPWIASSDLAEAFANSIMPINLSSILMAFAANYPDDQIQLMFVIPVKMKWIGILEAVLLGASFLQGGIYIKFAVVAGVFNFFVFFFSLFLVCRKAWEL